MLLSYLSAFDEPIFHWLRFPFHYENAILHLEIQRPSVSCIYPPAETAQKPISPSWGPTTVPRGIVDIFRFISKCSMLLAIVVFCPSSPDNTDRYPEGCKLWKATDADSLWLSRGQFLLKIQSLLSFLTRSIARIESKVKDI